MAMLALAATGGALFGSSAAASSPVLTRRLLRGANAAGRRSDAPISVSSNWAGYAVATPETPETPGQPATTAPATMFTSVTGTWTQPRATCTAGSRSYSAVWVGLGGLDPDSQALEQIGTDADCTATGASRYTAWYELVPAPPVELKLKILPGDTISASVNVTGTDVLVQIKNRTRHTSFTKQLTVAQPDLASAEWIVEAPSACSSDNRCSVLPLANFGSVSFTRIATIGNGQPGTLANPAWSVLPIRLLPDANARFSGLGRSAGAPGATPGAASPDGRSFSVVWESQPE
jgi:hypothetical protein